jgi:hypothetical protein
MKTGGAISILSDINTADIRIGFGEVGIFDQHRSRTIWQVSGEVVFKGKCSIGHGSKISVGEKGRLIFGKKFEISAESSIDCQTIISFGDNCVLSWDVLVMDSDYHKIRDLYNRKIINPDREIVFGNDVWVGCRCLILKGSKIPDHCIIAANTAITGSDCLNESSVVGGNPLRILKKDVTWEK